jgi:hypothetical protein
MRIHIRRSKNPLSGINNPFTDVRTSVELLNKYGCVLDQRLFVYYVEDEELEKVIKELKLYAQSC